MPYPTITECFIDSIDRYPSPKAQMFRTDSGWQQVSSAEMLRRVAILSKALHHLGVKRGDRVALYAPNCPEWHIGDFAILGLGAVDVPIYANESAERMTYILNDSGAKIAIVAGQIPIAQIAAAQENCPALEHIIAVSPPADLGGIVLRYETLIADHTEGDEVEYRHRSAELTPDNLATIIYTSGTTGDPKGVMLTHSNLASNAIDSLSRLQYLPTDQGLSFLPLAHVFERTMDYVYILCGISIAYVDSLEKVSQALLEVRPTIAAGVPRFFQKIYANIMEKGRAATGAKRKIFQWATRVAQRSAGWRARSESVGLATQLSWKLADRIAYSKIRDAMGGRMRMLISGGAPLSADLAAFFCTVGLPIYQGYGLTETSPVIAVNFEENNKVGTVGPPIPNVDVRIAEDGEILVRGPCVMTGYYGKPEQTREVFTEDGWFRTGDIGSLDADGYLIITDRKKDLLKTAGGKYVSPQLIEGRLVSSRYIANAMVVGDRHKFVSALVVPQFAAVESRAREEGKRYDSPEQAVSEAWLRELIQAEVDRLCAGLAQYEKPKRVALLKDDFTIANGEVTLSMKLKRRVVEQRYKDLIDSLYADVEEPGPQDFASI
jgi:long-chain acyl-CoA synthetase